MRLVDQSILHDPENGQWGDCMRACVATLLGLAIVEVPHFFDGGCDHAEFDKRVADFLEQHNLVELSMPADVARRTHYTRDCYHLMYGYTERGTFHAVVARNGLVIHDPHPSKTGIIDDDRVQFAFLVRTATIQSNPNGWRKTPLYRAAQAAHAGVDTELIAAVRKLVKAKGRFHTEQNYKALADALSNYDAAMSAATEQKEPRNVE